MKNVVLMKLSILIPTYNRSKYLSKNLAILNEYIQKGNYLQNIEIIVSNNNSADNTHDVVTSFQKENPNLYLRYFSQKENIGLEKNALYVLKEAIGEYVMYLGDDDYIVYPYLVEVINLINQNVNTKTIIPSIVAISTNGVPLGYGRDTNLTDKKYYPGFKNCIINSWRGHQLSGLLLKRENLYNSYLKRKVGNIYLFIYFVAFSCLNGDTYHLTKYPVKVTQPGQNNKDWGYGIDGLMNEVFDNYMKLQVNYVQKTILQLYFFYKQPWRLWRYKGNGFLHFWKSFLKIWISNNSTYLFRLLFPIEVLYLMIINRFNKLFGK